MKNISRGKTRDAIIDEVLELCKTAPFPDGKGLVEKIKALKSQTKGGKNG